MLLSESVYTFPDCCEVYNFLYKSSPTRSATDLLFSVHVGLLLLLGEGYHCS